MSGFFVPSRSGFLGWLGSCNGGRVGLWVVVAKWAAVGSWLAFVDFFSPVVI